MGSVLGYWRLFVAVLVFSLVASLWIDPTGSPAGGIGVAWADDDDDDGGDDDDDDGGGSGSAGTTGGAVGAGLSSPPSAGGGRFDEPDRATERRLEALGAARPDSGWRVLSADDRLETLHSGGWNRPHRSHAVRGELLAIGITPGEISTLAQAGFRLADRTNLGSIGLIASRFAVPAGRDVESALNEAVRLAPGAMMVPNHIYQFAGHADIEPCTDGGCYGHTLIGWEQVADSCGAGIRIGMTDTAIDGNHPALRGQALRTETFDPFGEGSVPDHGTAVAGLLIGNAETGFPGMLPGAELFAADVFHTNEDGESYSTLLSLIRGLDWLVESRVTVINVSMTGPPNDLLEETVRRMNNRGVVVVAAAGNGGPSAPPAYPAAYGDVVSVTAVDRELRPYSMANRGEYISFSSPGVQIWSAGEAGSGRRRTGTSFAAAHASAIIADVVRRGGRADVSKALGALQSAARDLGAPGKDPIFGWGLIQGTPACRI